MEKKWGKNPEFTVTIYCCWSSCWALPFDTRWCRYFDAELNNKGFYFVIGFLCFGFRLEMWRWAK